MIELGLTQADRHEFHNALMRSHSMRVQVYILNRDEKPVGAFHGTSKNVLTGNVNGDVTQDVTRRLDLNLIDPDYHIHLDTNSPAETAVWPSHLMEVHYGIFVETLGSDDNGGWVDVPVFCGPLTSYNRNGPEVTIEAMGKESLGLAPNVVWNAFSVEKGTKLVDAIKQLMRSVGETKFNLPTLSQRTRKAIAVPRMSEPWKLAKNLARGFNYQLFYDGRGRLCMRHRPHDPSFTFWLADVYPHPQQQLPSVVNPPQITYDFSETRNKVVVLGPAPQSGIRQLRAVAVLEPQNPLSPQSLARNGVPRQIVESITNAHILRQSEANDIAQDRLLDLGRVVVQAQFDSLPVPHLEEYDMAALVCEDPKYPIPYTEFSMQQWTLPMSHDSLMSVGYNRKVRLHHHR